MIQSVDCAHCISLGELFCYYYSSSLKQELREAVDCIFGDLIAKLILSQDVYREKLLENKMAELLLLLDPAWHFQTISTGMIQLGKHPIMPDWVFKIAARKTLPHMHPMAHVLRVPMSVFLKEIVQKNALVSIEIPDKVLIPLLSDELIAELGEEEYKDAYVVMAEKKECFSEKETISHIKQQSFLVQRGLAEELCILVKNGFIDLRWDNLLFSRKNGKLVLIDTEPLFGELTVTGVDREKFPRNIEMKKTMQQSVALGFKTFIHTSEMHGLSIFSEVAKKYAKAGCV